MRLIYVYIFSFLSAGVYGQDSLATKSMQFELALDYGKILTMPSNFETKIEGAAGLKFRQKLEVLAELGYADLIPQEAIKNGSYTSSGIYYRAGISYGGEILPKSILTIGVLYASSTFSDETTAIVRSTIWNDFDETYVRQKLTASWFEIILTTEQYIKNNVSLGAKFRLRNLNTYPKNLNPEVIAIPGYGQTSNSTVPAVNLFVKYFIGF